MTEADPTRGAHAIEQWLGAERSYAGISLPVRVRFEVDWDVPDDEEPIVTFLYGDRVLTASRVDARSLGRGTLERQLDGPVRIMVSLDPLTGGSASGKVYALPVAPPGVPVDDELGLPYEQPVVIPLLGPLELELPRTYGPEEGERAAIDAVLHCLYGSPAVAAARLIAELDARDGADGE